MTTASVSIERAKRGLGKDLSGFRRFLCRVEVTDRSIFAIDSYRGLEPSLYLVNTHESGFVFPELAIEVILLPSAWSKVLASAVEAIAIFMINPFALLKFQEEPVKKLSAMPSVTHCIKESSVFIRIKHVPFEFISTLKIFIINQGKRIRKLGGFYREFLHMQSYTQGFY